MYVPVCKPVWFLIKPVKFFLAAELKNQLMHELYVKPTDM